MVTLKKKDLARVLSLLKSPKLTREIRNALNVDKARPILIEWEKRGLIAKELVRAKKSDGNWGRQWLWSGK